MRSFINIFLLLLLFSAFSCNQKAVKTDEPGSFTEINQPQNLYLGRDLKSSVDSLYILYDHAINALSFADSFGARIYYERIFSIISDFDEETKSMLLEWSEYDSLIKKINSDYEVIFAYDVFDHEAEEIREDLTDYEEEVLGDSSGLNVTGLENEIDQNNIPLQMNRRVELALKYFQTKGRKVFTIWLERSGQYEHLIKPILREHDLPENLFYLAMIESGFNPKAFSYARASGLWQFIYATGSYYGLRSDWWFDERRDPLLATHAAAKHLKDLNDRFGDWYLALAGYNCNPKRIESNMRRYVTNDFWQLKRLPRQTRNYIPTFIAANIIAENPEKYGFVVNKLEPVVYDTTHISECVDLEIVAQCTDTTFDYIKKINPAVKRWCTPPGVDNFVLNVPLGKKDIFKANYAQIPDGKKRSWVRHRVRSGETLSVIASKYGSTVSVIKSYNKIRGSMIYVDQYILIPVPQNKNYYRYQAQYTSKSSPKRSVRKVIPNGYKKVNYIVKKGDTLGEIAENYHTRASKIRSWNGLYYGQHIYPNQKLVLWVPQDYKKSNTIIANTQTDLPEGSYHVVRYGDTLWDISQKYDISISNLKKLNNKRSNKIKPGEKLIIRPASGG